jgi:hypothetical protein
LIDCKIDRSIISLSTKTSAIGAIGISIF